MQWGREPTPPMPRPPHISALSISHPPSQIHSTTPTSQPANHTQHIPGQPTTHPKARAQPHPAQTNIHLHTNTSTLCQDTSACDAKDQARREEAIDEDALGTWAPEWFGMKVV